MAFRLERSQPEHRRDSLPHEHKRAFRREKRTLITGNAFAEQRLPHRASMAGPVLRAGGSLPADVDVLIVGAGHAGLTLSGLLTQTGREHLVVERRDRLGGGWQDRWDEFRLVTPNWTSSFPGWAYDGTDPDGFMTRDEITMRVACYAEVVRAPTILGTEVQRLIPLNERGFRAATNRGELVARQVVIATGSYHRPRISPLAERITPRVAQLHSHEYRNEAGLPPGAVLVIGSGQTGLQLAEELVDGGRHVYISVGSAGRVPRRYRGRDIFSWIDDVMRHGAAHGVTLPTAEELPDPRLRFSPMPGLSGHDGGHDTNLRQYAADGIMLAGRLNGADGEVLTFADDLGQSLERADAFFDQRLRGPIDSYIERAAIDAPRDSNLPVTYQPEGLTQLHLLREGISTIIWATGYALDYGWVDAPILDDLGYPKNQRGVSNVPGLYHLGLLWQHSQASASLVGPALDGPHLVERMALAATSSAKRRRRGSLPPPKAAAQ